MRTELCDRLGLSQEGDPRTPAELEAAILEGVEHADHISAGLDESGTALYPSVATKDGGLPVPFVDRFPH